MNKPELIFVYNADSGIFNAVSDTVHKTLSPNTYQCNLCRLTYGMVTEKKDWGNFVKGLSVKSTFLHKDEFTVGYPKLADTPLPAVFLKNGETKIFIKSSELNKQKTLEDLKKLVTTKLKNV